MKKKTSRRHADDLRAASKLAVAATQSITTVVEDMHRTIASGPRILGRPLALPARLLTSIVYEPIRQIAGFVGKGLDAAFAELAPLLGESTPGPERDAVVSALNGVLGDYLAQSQNPLAIEMSFRSNGVTLGMNTEELRAAYPTPSSKLLLLVHGSSMNDRQWSRAGHDHGASLAADFGLSAVYLHYNSGLHVSTNGAALAALVEELVRVWPVPVEEIDIIGHSMGGLVARSACHTASARGLSWTKLLRRLVCIGTPHHGSPLELGGSWLHAVLGVSAYSAPIARLARIRSAGVTDLRYGNVLEEHWQGRDRFATSRDTRRALPLPEGVACYAIAGTTAKEASARLPGDGLVPVNSALGINRRRELTLGFPEAHQWIAFGTGHVELLSRREVYDKLASWFTT